MSDGDEIVVSRVELADAEAFAALRLEALRGHPLAFTADLAEAEGRSVEAWREQVGRATGEGADVIMLARAADGSLAGMAGVFTPKQPKLMHAGTVWGVYVREGYRGRGVGERLVRACVEWARGAGLVVLRLSVVEGNDAARRCYERCGFAVYGVEPAVVRWQGRLYDETLMAMRLGGRGNDETRGTGR